RWPRVRPPRAQGTGGRVPVSRGEGWPRTERRALLREDPAQARRADARRTVRVPGLRDEVGAPDRAAPRVAGRGVRKAWAAGAAHGPAGPEPPVPRAGLGVLTPTRLA